MADEFTKAALYGIKTFNKKVKEKIGIEKLLSLLNEFETPQSGVVFKSYDDYDGTFYGVDIDGETEIAWSDSYICGKRFGWVEWLVENDKIDRERFMNEHLDFEFFKQNYDGEGYWYECVGYYESILCCLAIQDEPIRFLCEILK